jgi:hypothetical protein
MRKHLLFFEQRERRGYCDRHKQRHLRAVHLHGKQHRLGREQQQYRRVDKHRWNRYVGQLRHNLRDGYDYREQHFQWDRHFGRVHQHGEHLELQ